ncbi:hypothetical protein Tco_1556300 [Tanacetum coccineum]
MKLVDIDFEPLKEPLPGLDLLLFAPELVRFLVFFKSSSNAPTLSESLVTKFINSLSFKLPSSLPCEGGLVMCEGEGEDVILEGEVEGVVTTNIEGKSATSCPENALIEKSMSKDALPSNAKDEASRMDTPLEEVSYNFMKINEKPSWIKMIMNSQ